MERAVFRARAFQRQRSLLKIKLRPTHVGNLAKALACQQEQLAKLLEGIAFGFAAAPEGYDFVVGQPAVARHLLDKRLQGSHRRYLDNALVDAPRIQLLDRSQSAVRSRALATRSFDVGDHRLEFTNHVGALDLVDGLVVQLLHAQENALRPLPVLRVALGVPVDELRDNVTERRRRRLRRARNALGVFAEGNVAQKCLGRADERLRAK